MKVALVTPRFPPEVGGMENYVGWVARTLSASPDHEVVVVSTTRGRRTTYEQWHGIQVIRLGTWMTLSNTPLSPAWWWQVRRLLRSLEVDVVNAHAPVPGLADVAAYRSPVPVVMTYHAGSLLKGGGAIDVLLRAYERHVLPRVFARCAELVAVSPVSRAMASGRAHLVPPGVDTGLFTPPAGPADRLPRVLYVGRVEQSSRWKGVQVLIEALPRLVAEMPDVRLQVVGGGDDVDALRARASRLGVADAVEWQGTVEHGSLPEVYRGAAVTVLPSLTEAESFGMTLVEAMSCGCPVVASDVGGIPFVVRDGVDGLLVPPGDPSVLAESVLRVLRDPVLADELGTAGRGAAVETWDWGRQRARTLEVLTSAAAGGRPARGLRAWLRRRTR